MRVLSRGRCLLSSRWPCCRRAWPRPPSPTAGTWDLRARWRRSFSASSKIQRPAQQPAPQPLRRRGTTTQARTFPSRSGDVREPPLRLRGQAVDHLARPVRRLPRVHVAPGAHPPRRQPPPPARLDLVRQLALQHRDGLESRDEHTRTRRAKPIPIELDRRCPRAQARRWCSLASPDHRRSPVRVALQSRRTWKAGLERTITSIRVEVDEGRGHRGRHAVSRSCCPTASLPSPRTSRPARRETPTRKIPDHFAAEEAAATATHVHYLIRTNGFAQRPVSPGHRELRGLLQTTTT